MKGWPKDRRRLLVKFVTGSDRLPAPGSELFRIEMPFVPLKRKEVLEQLGMLPQAHTCENTLELPNYYDALLAHRSQPAAGGASAAYAAPSAAGSVSGGVSAAGAGRAPRASEAEALQSELREVIDQRLQVAVTNCQSYGLDSVEAGGTGAGEAAGRLGAPLPALPGQRRPSANAAAQPQPLPQLPRGSSAENAFYPLGARAAAGSGAGEVPSWRPKSVPGLPGGAAAGAAGSQRDAGAGSGRGGAGASVGDTGFVIRRPTADSQRQDAEGSTFGGVERHGSSATSIRGDGGDGAAAAGGPMPSSSPMLLHSAVRPAALGEPLQSPGSSEGALSPASPAKGGLQQDDWKMESCDDFEEQVKQLLKK